MTESREQELINQIVDGEESPVEWREFSAMADANPLHWRELAQTQRDHAAITRALRDSSSLAEAVALPEFTHVEDHHETRRMLKFNRFGAFTGWAVAAMVAIIASLQQLSLTGTPSSGLNPNSPRIETAGFGTAAEAFQAYLDKGLETGEVVGEIPDRLLVESKPAVSGMGVEVIYVRQVMERVVVPDLYQVSGQDEAGRPTLVRYQHSVRKPM